jgi:hypothetical protein
LFSHFATSFSVLVRGMASVPALAIPHSISPKYHKPKRIARGAAGR